MDTVGWQHFVETCQPRFASCVFKIELISACDGLDDIACVAFSIWEIAASHGFNHRFQP